MYKQQKFPIQLSTFSINGFGFYLPKGNSYHPLRIFANRQNPMPVYYYLQTQAQGFSSAEFLHVEKLSLRWRMQGETSAGHAGSAGTVTTAVEQGAQ